MVWVRVRVSMVRDKVRVRVYVLRFIPTALFMCNARRFNDNLQLIKQPGLLSVDEIKCCLCVYTLQSCAVGYNQSYRYHFINRWNSLTQEKVDAPSVNSFKHHLAKKRLWKMDFFMD